MGAWIFWIEGQLQFPKDGQPRPYAARHRCDSDHLEAARFDLARAGFRDHAHRRDFVQMIAKPVGVLGDGLHRAGVVGGIG